MPDSLGNLYRIEAFKANADINGKSVVFVDSGVSVICLVEATSISDVSFMLGSDIREKDRLHTLRDWLPDSILEDQAQSQVKAKIDDFDIILTNRDNNPSNPFVTFEVQKVL